MGRSSSKKKEDLCGSMCTKEYSDYTIEAAKVQEVTAKITNISAAIEDRLCSIADSLV